MLCKKFFSILFFLILFCASRVLAEEGFDDSLRQARKLVDDKSYAEALDVYSRIGKELRRDPGLVIEWARVYTYADRHEEAIKLFEEVLSNYPERSSEILRELADQYKWSGQL
ncbi:MAG: hypothetical protein WC412_09185, partial [Candidatus Omnitrophota bacterium]